MYGLNTPQSDTDYRGIYLHSDVGRIIGIDKNGEHHEDRSKDDEVYYEFRHFLGLCRKTNTMAMELLFNETWIEKLPFFDDVLKHKLKLLDSEKLFKSLKGYMFNERRLMNGERTGNLGGKRKEALDIYGYSYKNAVQLFRLAYAGSTLFEKGYFPTNILKDNPEFAKELLEIKTHPEQFKVEELNLRVDKAEEDLNKAFDNRNFDYKFDEDMANELCIRMYLPILLKS